MSEQDDLLSPHGVDESIERLSVGNQSEGREPMTPTARLMRDMQQLYGVEHKHYLRALQRVEKRLVAQRVPPRELSTETRAREWRREDRRKGFQRDFKMKENRLPSKIGRQLSLLAATLVVLLLVGSLVVVLNFVHRSAAVGSLGATATPTQAAGVTPTPASDPFGHTVYVTPGVQDTFEGLAWSSDSQRVASVTIGSIQIWDATTGGHRVSVHLKAADGQPLSVAWSPVPGSQMIAVGTTKVMLLINAATGAIVHTYTPTQGSIAAVSGGSSLVAHLPVSGYDNDPRAVAWSPDGRFLAVAVNHNHPPLQSEEIHVFDVQNFSLAYTLHPPSQDYDVYALAWSPDGKYLAGGGSTVALTSSSTVVWSWDVSTRQMVFRHGGGSDFGPGLAFQPGGGHNLIFIGPSKDIEPTALGLWDVATGQLIRAYQTVSKGQVAWSPDARYLAYVEATSNLIGIMDVQSGQLVFTYQGHSAQASVCQLAWSPNGKYIVSGECQGQTNTMAARVWTAGFTNK